LEHYFCGLDYSHDCVADFERHLFCASAGYHAFDEIVSNLDDNMSHYSTELKFRYLAFKPVARG
jgi:hypothetical protein